MKATTRVGVWRAAAALCGAAVLATALVDAAAAAPVLGFAPATPPNQSAAIPLGPGQAGAAPETWETFQGELILRNVRQPTITPFLPTKDKATGAAVIVAPGGGFVMLSMENEGYAVARWLAEHGIAAFVLKYRVLQTGSAIVQPDGSIPKPPPGPTSGPMAGLAIPPNSLADAQSAVRLIRSRAQEWGVDPARIGFLGFSSGASLTLGVSLSGDTSTRPNFIATIYGPPGPRETPTDAPPLFTAVALDDQMKARRDPTGLMQSWHAAHRAVEGHFLLRGGHGFGMARKTPSTALWIDEFHAWLETLGVLKSNANRPQPLRTGSPATRARR